ncbi:MAG TPA: metal-sensitive transcriptional regulator, partial [Thermoleophilia bacterium]|nr:metal-sensitive transcriptional regulator [Thermoleophilia bacterium]
RRPFSRRTPRGILSAMSEARTPAGHTTSDVDKVVNRLKRIEGQVRGLQRMVADDEHCEDILTQLSATRAALDRVGITLITHKVRECLLDEDEASSEAAVQRALETFQKYAQHLQAPPGGDRA